jgi:hypothetical protein
MTGADPVALAPGDVLTLEYAQAGEVLADGASWCVLVRAGAGGTEGATPARRGPTVAAMPNRFALHPNQPDPSREGTHIGFDLPVASPVTVRVFDLLGRYVATPVQGDYPAGTHTIEWDLRCDDGSRARPGVYVCRMTAGEFSAIRKLSVIR